MPEDGTKGIGDLVDTLRKVPAVPTRMPETGDVFAGRYDIQRTLGRGGMGVVYLANQSPLGRQVALKVLRPPESLEDDPNFDERFLREAAAAARLQHPNTITVHDFGQDDDGALFIVMEYLEGNDLRTVISHEGPFHPQRAIHVAKQVCKSLREAHRKGIIHRDLKPANVLLLRRDDDDDFVKVLDFGLVKFRGEQSELTLAGKFLGSPRYTSPEALDRNKDVDHRADIYAVGILLYAMVVGEPPFGGDPMQVLHAHLHEVPQPMYKANPSAETTPEFEALVARCLRKEPDERFQSMNELLLALRRVGSELGADETETLDLNMGETLELDEEPTEKPAPRATPSVAKKERPAHRRKRRRKQAQMGGLVAAGLVLLAALAWLLWPDGSPSEGELLAANPDEIQMAEARYLDVVVESEPPGAEVRVGFDGNWTLVGTTPVTLEGFRAPDDYRVTGLRLLLDGYEPVETLIEPADGKLAWSGALRPEARPEPTPRPQPVAKPAPAKPKPVAKPAPAKPKPKPSPRVAASPHRLPPRQRPR